MKISFHGPIATSDIIRTSVSKIFQIQGGLLDSDVQIEKLTTTPNPTSVIGLADSDFGFSTAIDLSFDSA